MRHALLKQLTCKDIREILDAASGQEDEHAILHQLFEENGCPPPIAERFPDVLRAAEQTFGRRLSDERNKDNTTMRAIITYRLREDGYTHGEIGRVLQRDHSSVTYLCRKVPDMLSVPSAYREELEKLKEFEALLAQPRQCSQPSSHTTSASALAESPAR